MPYHHTIIVLQMDIIYVPHENGDEPDGSSLYAWPVS